MTLAAITLFGLAAIVPAQTPPQAASQKPAQLQRTIDVPKDLPPPVAEEARVKGDDIDTLLAKGKVLLLDVREPWELKEFGTLDGYINIPIGQLEKRLNELPKDKAILTA